MCRVLFSLKKIYQNDFPDLWSGL